MKKQMGGPVSWGRYKKKENDISFFSQLLEVCTGVNCNFSWLIVKEIQEKVC